MESASLLRFATDQRLAEHVAAGSDRAFEALFDRWRRPILAFCRHMLGSREEAEDALQHTFMAAYRDIGRSGPPAAVRPWLFVIARNHCISILRARRELPAAEVPEPATHQLAADVDVREELRAIFAGLARLPEDQRAALVLTELGDVSHDEIARILDCRREQVKSYVFQARSALAADRVARETPCAEIRSQLVELRGGSLRRNAIRRHLTDCPGCRAYRDTLRTQRRQLRALFPVAPALALKRALLGGVLGGGGGGGAVGVGGIAATALVAIAIPASGAAFGKDERPREQRTWVTAGAPAQTGREQEGARPQARRPARLAGDPAPAATGEARGAPGDGGRETARGQGEGDGTGGGRDTASGRDEPPPVGGQDRGTGREPETEPAKSGDSGRATTSGQEENGDKRRGRETAPGQEDGRDARRGRERAPGRWARRGAARGRRTANDRADGRGAPNVRAGRGETGGRAENRGTANGRAETRDGTNGGAHGRGDADARSERRRATQPASTDGGGTRNGGSQPSQGAGTPPRGSGAESQRALAGGAPAEPGASGATPAAEAPHGGQNPGNESDEEGQTPPAQAGDPARGGGSAAQGRRQDAD